MIEYQCWKHTSHILTICHTSPYFFFIVPVDCTVKNGGCVHRCVTKRGKGKCVCNAGFVLAMDKRTCEGTLIDNGT